MNPPGSFYWIITAGMKRMAFQYTHGADPDCLKEPFFFECLSCVFGTGWRKPAGGRQQERDSPLVPLNQKNE